MELLCRGIDSKEGRRSVYTRGAVTAGELVHDGSKVFGPALVEAHKMEREAAVYPRLLVAGSAKTFTLGAPKTSADPALGPYQVRRDRDGLEYLDILPTSSPGKRWPWIRSNAVQAKEMVQTDLHRTNTDQKCRSDQVLGLKLRAKYGWMLSYLDDVIQDPVEDPGV
jgi:hypothetical protein